MTGLNCLPLYLFQQLSLPDRLHYIKVNFLNGITVTWGTTYYLKVITKGPATIHQILEYSSLEQYF